MQVLTKPEVRHELVTMRNKLKQAESKIVKLRNQVISTANFLSSIGAHEMADDLREIIKDME
jgi:hypothetical protein